VLAAIALWPASPGFAQVLERPRGFVEPDLGPASRPTGVPPNSGLAPGRQAFPPGDPNAYGPAPSGGVLRLEPPKLTPPPTDPPAAASKKRQPPALPRASGRADD
jgi:hypothetical protein